MALDPLLTLNEYKSLVGLDPTDTRDDTQIKALLAPASRAVRTFTGRPFELSGSTATARSYQYDGSGFIDIDDCTEVVSISTDTGMPGLSYDLSSDEWTAMPQDDSDVFYYLLVHSGPFLGGSPEMGFKSNMDTLGIRPKAPLLEVTANWGWVEIPEDVKLAAALTLKGLVGPGIRDESLTAQSIEGYSQSYGGRAGAMTSLAIPNRARDLLVGYQRIFT